MSRSEGRPQSTFELRWAPSESAVGCSSGVVAFGSRIWSARSPLTVYSYLPAPYLFIIPPRVTGAAEIATAAVPTKVPMSWVVRFSSRSVGPNHFGVADLSPRH